MTWMMRSLQPFRTTRTSGSRIECEALIKQWDGYASSSEREEKLDDLRKHTRQLLAHPVYTSAIHVVAEKLLEQKQLTGQQARTLINRAMNEAKNAVTAHGNQLMKIECPHCAEYDEER